MQFKSWHKQQNYLLSKTSRPAPTPTHPPTEPFSLPVKWQCRQSDHSCLYKGKFKIQWSYTSTQTVSLHGTYWYNLILPLPPTYVHISTGYILSGLIKQPFLYITYPLHAHYMTHLFHLHSSNYINIMKSSNNQPHYILLSVLLLLTPSIGQIFSS